MKNNFLPIENALRDFVLKEFEFNADEKYEIIEYLNAGEYGLALEITEEIIKEKELYLQKKLLSKLELIKKLLIKKQELDINKDK